MDAFSISIKKLKHFCARLSLCRFCMSFKFSHIAIVLLLTRDDNACRFLSRDTHTYDNKKKEN